MNIGKGTPSDLFLSLNTFDTAETSSAIHDIPYTVSVGMQITPPSNKIFAAMTKDSLLIGSICVIANTC